MTKDEKIAKFMQYLTDLSEIYTEHVNSCKNCMNDEKSAFCELKATIVVEITTYRIKVSEIV